MSVIEESIVNGFQMAAAAGPLCDEPMQGVCFIVEEVSFSKEEEAAEGHYFGPLTGQVISAVKECCRQAFMKHSVRLVEPMYICYLEVSESALRPVYSVLAKRRASIRREEMREGSDVFEIEALLPVIESFGFADELLSWARGAVSIPSLVFSQWSELQEDPFFVPTTDEELEEFGSNYKYLKNRASELIITVRRRKGLRIEEQIVDSGDKQRTLAKKK